MENNNQIQTQSKLNLHPDVKAKVESKKWFYTDTVKDHFFNPHNIFMDAKEAEEYAKTCDGIGMVGSPACGDAMKMWIKIDGKEDKIKELKWETFGSLLPGEKILMSDYTTKPVENLSIGDKIIDGEGKVNFVEEVLPRNYEGKVITFKLSTSKFYSISVTPNHPIPCLIRKKITLVNRNNRWSEVNEELINGTEVTTLPACEIKEGDFLLFNIPKDTQDIKELNEDMCTLLGYYVSDGNAPSNSRTIFYFNLDEQEYINEIELISKKYNWNYIVFPRKTSTGLCIQINNPGITQLLRKYGGLPGKKRFSNEIMQLPAEKQILIIDSYIKGDGWESKQGENENIQYFISTSLEHIAFQLQIMLARNFIFAPIHKRESREFTIRGKNYRNSGEYNIIFKKIQKQSRFKFDFKGGNILIPISKIFVNDYNGKIYDIGIVNEPHTYRINGVSIHNCASAIASTSMLSVMVTENGGMKIEGALKLKPQDIIARLGNLPSRKFHCSVLGDKALRSAINDYFRRSNQNSRIIVEGARIIDPETKTTDKDIEEAVLEGALTIEDVQKKLKVGIGNKAVIPAVEELIRFYKEKYFG